jgi:hypothetical protein
MHDEAQVATVAPCFYDIENLALSRATDFNCLQWHYRITVRTDRMGFRLGMTYA